jgi:hypothetical protein
MATMSSTVGTNQGRTPTIELPSTAMNTTSTPISISSETSSDSTSEKGSSSRGKYTFLMSPALPMTVAMDPPSAPDTKFHGSRPHISHTGKLLIPLFCPVGIVAPKRTPKTTV